MRASRLFGALALLALLSGCTPLLEREYSTVEPHSSRFWESEAAGTLRAENYQDIVNDLLILIGQHTESATLWLYNVEGDLAVADTLERAAVEVQQETPMGAYAVEYITASSEAQRGYYQVEIQIGYRRTAEQMQAVVSATSPAALYSLLESALAEGKTELAVRIGYWGQDGQARVEEAVAQIREDQGLTETRPWTVFYYPDAGPVGMIEFLLEDGELPEAEDDPEAAVPPSAAIVPGEAAPQPPPPAVPPKAETPPEPPPPEEEPEEPVLEPPEEPGEGAEEPEPDGEKPDEEPEE